jgi:DEAD/DEAH box helicase domain-containing protein
MDDLMVALVLPGDIVEDDLREDLLAMKAVGIELTTLQGEVDDSVVAQLVFPRRIQTIASSEPATMMPGKNWHQAGGLTVTTDDYPVLAFAPLDTKLWSPDNPQPIKPLEIQNELNGSLTGFGQRFWDHLAAHVDGLGELMDANEVISITYSDRYLQCPAYVLMLTELLRPIASKLPGDHKIQLKTLFKSKERNGYKMFHDWADQDEFEEFVAAWIPAQCGVAVELDVVNANRDIPHHRKLEVGFADGSFLTIRFDQGVGYWRLEGRDTRFDFQETTEHLLDDTRHKLAGLKILNSERWSTDLVVEICTS